MSAAADASARSASPPSDGDGDDATPRISVVCTVLDERKHIRDLLDSLVLQRPAHEIVVIDAGSTDGTWEMLQDHAERFPTIRPFQVPGRRGAGRNAGVAKARAPYVAFIDGDCQANAFWLERLRDGFEKGADIVAGQTRYHGYWAFARMQRVELAHRGHDVSWPSCNLGYRRDLFMDVGGFDERFVTAEDIDLNFRAIDQGATMHHQSDAIVYARARDSVEGFMRQAFWNGYGRKQLTLKHGRLWGDYSFRRMGRQQTTFWGTMRLGAAVLGYLRCKFREPRGAYKDDDGAPNTENTALYADQQRDGASA